MPLSSLRLFTSESVTEGHPDKVCDRISDSILDAILAQDPAAHVAVETMATTGLVHVAGEVTTNAYVEIPEIVRSEIVSIGYTSSEVCLDGASCGVSISIGQQSPDIAAGVDKALEVRGDSGDLDPLDFQGAGDQGLMFGYACTDTAELMPLPIHLAHRLAERLTLVRKQGLMTGLRPDGKTQVTIGYDGDRAVSLRSVVVSTQHDPSRTRAWLTDAITSEVIRPVLQAEEDKGLQLATANAEVLVNPSGQFVIGGPAGDAGLTGRKIIVAGAPSPARIRPRSIDPAPTPCAGSPRTSSQRVLLGAARFRLPMPSAPLIPWACTLRPSAPRQSPSRGSPPPSRRSSTCARPQSCAISICFVRSTALPAPTDTSAVLVSPGRRPAAPRPCAPRSNPHLSCRAVR